MHLSWCRLVSKKIAADVAGSVNLESIYIYTGEPYEVIKVSVVQIFRATGGWKFEQRDAVDTTNCKKMCLYQKTSFPLSMFY